MKEIKTELRNEILYLTKNGKTQKEISDITGCARATIRKYQREAGLEPNDPTNKGGRISRNIPITELTEAKSSTAIAEEEEESCPVMIADQTLKIVGADTMIEYRAELSRKTISVEGSLLVGEIEIDKLLSIAKELKAVHKMVTKMKQNRFETV